MQIIQIIPTIAYGDAVSNDTVALKTVIKSMGYHTKIYAESVVAPYDSKVALSIDKLKSVEPDDVIIYHFSTGSQLNFDIAEYKCRKIMIYHNVTPPEFFENNDNYIRGINEWGLEGAKYLKDKMDYCLADSEFNKQNLIDMGYTCPIDVLPIIIPLKDYLKKPNKVTIKECSDGYTNILFAGRIAPNKKQENIIAAFYYYKKLYNPKAKLILAGSYKPEDVYYKRLIDYIRRLGIRDVIMTGHKKFDSILAYYRTADVFLCMSEHEGFCVPLVEAMIFDVPVIAYDTTAVAGTLGGSGMLIDNNDPVFTAGCIDRLVKDKSLRKQIVERQRERLVDFEYDKIAEMFKGYLTAFLNKKD
ncbi:MAG: glycosyltransferase family 4 protein [Eubacteriales bacterium]|nr:glycosyltransferase family 4 protein [Eubacteriales bacterium]